MTEKISRKQGQPSPMLKDEIKRIEENIDYADSVTSGSTRDNSPRPKNVRLPLVSPEKHKQENPYSK